MDRANKTGNRYRWLLRKDGTVLRWATGETLYDYGRWKPASRRMTKIIRMKAAPEYVW